MSRQWNAVGTFSVGIVFVTIVLLPLPEMSRADRPLDVGQFVVLQGDCIGRPWKIVGTNKLGDTFVLRQGEEEAIVAAWECVPAR